ncbi:hypothetical protein D3C72_2299300 [compost metagenome]
MPFRQRANTGPARITVGIARMVPNSRVLPISAWKMVAIAVGPGCGGRKPWVTESAAAIGTPTYSSGMLAAAAMVNTSGSISTKPTS